MAIGTVGEFAGAVKNEGGLIQMVSYPGLAAQPVDFTAGVTASSAFNASTRIIRVCLDTTAYYKIGTAPTATTSDEMIPANSPEYFAVQSADKISLLIK